MYELAVVLHDESGNNKGSGIQLIKEGSHAERIRYDASVTPHVLHAPGISCPEITSLKTASTGHGTDITSLQNTITTLQTTINTQASTITALNTALTNLTNRVETLEDPMAAVHVDNN